MNELHVITGIFIAGPLVAALILSWDEWQARRRSRAAIRQDML